MFLDYKIIIVIPAGRKQYLDILFPQLLKYSEIVDEYRIWVNTTNEDDIKFMTSFVEKNPKFILERLTVPYRGNASINSFFKNCYETKTVYIRFDDDIIIIDDLFSFKNFLKFRIENPEYFLIFANILNNNIINNINQRVGTLPTDKYIADYSCMGNYWTLPQYSEYAHYDILKIIEETGTLSSFHINLIWRFMNYERVSINCISWLGDEFKDFEGIVIGDEEDWLTTKKPKEIKKMNCMFGGFTVIHYAFYTQRPHLDKTNILSLYKSIYSLLM